MIAFLRLQIPGNWTVSHNNFYDVDPIYDDKGNIENWYHGFTQDVLWIQQCFLNNGIYSTPQSHCFDIDITYSGLYVARLLYTNNKSANEIDCFESADRLQIRDKIETWLIDISKNPGDYKKRFGLLFPDE